MFTSGLYCEINTVELAIFYTFWAAYTTSRVYKVASFVH